MGEYDEAAKLCEQEVGRLRGYLAMRGVGRHVIDDVLQDTFVIVCRKHDEVTAHPNPTALLYTIARGVAADKRRADTSRAANEQTWYWQRGSHSSSSDLAELVVRDLDLQAALARLTLRQREVVYLHRCADMALNDVAVVLGISVGAAKSHLRRGQRRLCQLLNGKGTGDSDATG